MDIKISKVNITLKDKKKISLTIEEAIELKQLLTKTFDKEDPCMLYPSYPYYPPICPWSDSTINVPGIWDGAVTLDSFTTTTIDCDWTAWSKGATLTLGCS